MCMFYVIMFITIYAHMTVTHNNIKSQMFRILKHFELRSPPDYYRDVVPSEMYNTYCQGMPTTHHNVSSTSFGRLVHKVSVVTFIKSHPHESPESQAANILQFAKVRASVSNATLTVLLQTLTC